MILAPGAPAPRQSTPTTCGSACLVVARALAEPAFASWLDSGDAGGRAVGLAGATPGERFASYEALVKRRTVSARGLAGWQLPWPGALGTPPWGAARELAAVSGLRPRGVRVEVTRWLAPGRREGALRRAADSVTPSRSALLYVGSATVPRHVCLVARPDAGAPVVYEPSAGAVRLLDVGALASTPGTPGHETLGGWPYVWLVAHAR